MIRAVIKIGTVSVGALWRMKPPNATWATGEGFADFIWFMALKISRNLPGRERQERHSMLRCNVNSH